MKTKMRSGAKRGEVQIALEEFSEYYIQEWGRWVAEDESRADWAPRNPKRLFNLALKKLYPDCCKKMSIWAFLSEIYKTLGVHAGKPEGLFQAFDPARYHGKLPLASHFVNLFKGRLRANLHRALKAKTNERKCKKPEVYRAFGSNSRSPGQKWELTGLLHEMVARLGESERAIIRLRYWEGLSDRGIGRQLVIDHKKVKRRHDSAINKLRSFFEDTFRERAA